MTRAVLVPLFALAVLVVGVAPSPAGRSAPMTTRAITPSPAYTADQLSAPAGDDWLTNMGSLNGNRYSSLTQINKSNVATLKQAWKINLGTCPTKDQQCGSFNANAAVAERRLLHPDAEERRVRVGRRNGRHALAFQADLRSSLRSRIGWKAAGRCGRRRLGLRAAG